MYIKESDSKKRKDFIEFLEKNGYAKDETEFRSRQEIIEGGLPIKVDTYDRTYSMMGNVTCAAGAASSGSLVSVEEAYGKIALLDKKEP